MIEMIKRFFRDEDGATMVEYGMMVALIAAVCVAVVGDVGEVIDAAFDTVLDEMN